MKQGFEFKRLMGKYKVDFTLVHRKQVGFKEGKAVFEKEVCQEMRGVILPLAGRKIYGVGGVLTEKDRQLIMTTPLEKPLQGVFIEYLGERYSLEEEKEYTGMARLGFYLLRRVEAFD